MGNYGVNPADVESAVPQVQGLVVRDVSALPTGWRARQALPQYLRQHDVVGLSGVDTRALTLHIRERGAMRGVLSSMDRDADSLVRKAREAPNLGDQDLVAEVTCREPRPWSQPRDAGWRDGPPLAAPAERLLCVAYDFGMKRNILRLLHEAGFDLIVVPAGTDPADALALAPRAVFLSNGPGDPTVPTYAIAAARALVGRLPLLGICLGHQIVALALGGKTFKMKFGHRGANHPVRDTRTGRVAVTAQNHGYAVDPESLPAGTEITHVSLNDGTCEGFARPEDRLLTMQFHPEASPGPHDSIPVFRAFREMAGRSEEDSEIKRGEER